MPHAAYQARLARLARRLGDGRGGFRLGKRTTSNLFRYAGGERAARRTVSLAAFNHVLDLDRAGRVLEVEGLCTYAQVVAHTLPRGFLPAVTPELRHITVGGAVVGIGIESSGFRHGFVHDGLLEVDVLLPDGAVVTCTPDNGHADLLRGLANSYGTLGYILRAKIRLIPAKPRVRVTNTRHHDAAAYLDAMRGAADNGEQDFLEGLFYSADEFYLTRGVFADGEGEAVDIHREIYYKKLRGDAAFDLKTEDYIFRYDPDWFWNVPEGGVYRLFRKYAPRAMRSSAFYNRYTLYKHRVQKILGVKPDTRREKLIQDWEVPWRHAEEFTRFALSNVDLQGQPWVALPIRPQTAATCYPVAAGELLFNVGCYCLTERPKSDVDFHYTRLLDEKCFALSGIKMLYSSTFLSPDEFAKIYNGAAADKLKQKYDPKNLAPSLYEKTVAAK